MLARTTDDVASTLDVSLPTAYRYVRWLVEAGPLQRGENSHYTLGPRIILLDHYMGGISLVLDVQRLSIVDTGKLAGRVAEAAKRISSRLS